MSSETRVSTYTTSENVLLKIRRWSTGKFFTLFEKFQEISELLADVTVEITRAQKDKQEESEDDPEALKSFVSVIFRVLKHAHMRLDFIIEESIYQAPEGFQAEDLLPEDYLGLLAHVIEQNITVHAVKNLKRLLASFSQATKNVATT